MLSIILVASLAGLKEKERSNEGQYTLIIKTLGETTKENITIDGSNVLNNIDGRIRAGRLECIENICSKNGFWWNFYVNDKLVLYAVDNYYPRDGDIIELEYGDGR